MCNKWTYHGRWTECLHDQWQYAIFCGRITVNWDAHAPKTSHYSHGVLGSILDKCATGYQRNQYDAFSKRNCSEKECWFWPALSSVFLGSTYTHILSPKRATTWTDVRSLRYISAQWATCKGQWRLGILTLGASKRWKSSMSSQWPYSVVDGLFQC